MLAESLRSAQSIVDSLQVFNQQILLQRYIEESSGSDLRAFVVGDRVVATMRRTACKEEFRSNVHRGASTKPHTLDVKVQELAVRAVKSLNLQVAGVDLIESKDGILVLEVNASPGLEGIEGATEFDVAGEIIDFAAKQVQR
jgi:ribosomal protein S6--L-glutamate ligase